MLICVFLTVIYQKIEKAVNREQVSTSVLRLEELSASLDNISISGFMFVVRVRN
jgi:hypothetical protein